MSHKTITRLVEIANRKYAASVEYNENNPKGYPDYAYVSTKKEGREVWAVQIMDGEYTLRHYGADLLTINGSQIIEHRPHISVSDQQGMNGFLEALGAPKDYYISRQGRTAKYGGIR